MHWLPSPRFLLMALAAVVVNTLWMFAMPGSAFRAQIEDRWFAPDPPPKSVDAGPGYAVIDTPYPERVIRDHFPSTADVALNHVVPGIIFIALGFGCAHLIRRRPMLHAVAVACIGITWVFAASLPFNLEPMADERYGGYFIRLYVLMWLAYCAGAAILCALGAKLAIRWRSRAATESS